MELIAAVTAGPLGYLLGRRGLAVYLALWAIVFPIQTIVVHSENADDIVASYFVVNALILTLGITLNRLGARLRTRRTPERDDLSRRGSAAAEPAVGGGRVVRPEALVGPSDDLRDTYGRRHAQSPIS
jgi:hypothetical protein